MTSVSGDSSDYDAHDEGQLEAALDRAWADYDSGRAEGAVPTGIRVTARVEWAGVEDRARGGRRTTRMDVLRLAPVRQALDRARAASRRAGEARPATSYQAKSWHAQLRTLTASARGSAAADRAGLNPSARTLTEWLGETRPPSKANQEKIAEAYRSLGTWKVDTASERAGRARHELAQALSDALGERYGSEIRLRDITEFRLE